MTRTLANSEKNAEQTARNGELESGVRHQHAQEALIRTTQLLNDYIKSLEERGMGATARLVQESGQD